VGAAGQHKGVAPRASVGLAPLHKAVADARAHGQVGKGGIGLARAKQRLGQRGGAHVRLHHGRGQGAEALLYGLTKPGDRVVTGDAATRVHQFGHAHPNALNRLATGGCLGQQRGGKAQRVGQHGSPAPRGPSGYGLMTYEAAGGQLHQAAAYLGATHIKADRPALRAHGSQSRGGAGVISRPLH